MMEIYGKNKYVVMHGNLLPLGDFCLAKFGSINRKWILNLLLIVLFIK